MLEYSAVIQQPDSLLSAKSPQEVCRSLPSSPASISFGNCAKCYIQGFTTYFHVARWHCIVHCSLRRHSANMWLLRLVLILYAVQTHACSAAAQQLGFNACVLFYFCTVHLGWDAGTTDVGTSNVGTLDVGTFQQTLEPCLRMFAGRMGKHPQTTRHQLRVPVMRFRRAPISLTCVDCVLVMTSHL